MVGKQSLLFPNYCLLQSSSLKEVFFFLLFFFNEDFYKRKPIFQVVGSSFQTV